MPCGTFFWICSGSKIFLSQFFFFVFFSCSNSVLKPKGSWVVNMIICRKICHICLLCVCVKYWRFFIFFRLLVWVELKNLFYILFFISLDEKVKCDQHFKWIKFGFWGYMWWHFLFILVNGKYFETWLNWIELKLSFFIIFQCRKFSC